MEISFHSYANKTNFHMKSFALSFAFVMRFKQLGNGLLKHVYTMLERPAPFATSSMVGRENKRMNNRATFLALKNNAAAGYQGLVKKELLKDAGLLTIFVHTRTKQNPDASRPFIVGARESNTAQSRTQEVQHNAVYFSHSHYSFTTIHRMRQ